VLIVETVFLIVFWTWVVCAGLFLRETIVPLRPSESPPRGLALPFETVHFPATDGVLLEGWRIPGQATKPWIILCHGTGATRTDLLGIAEGLHRDGFNLLLFDFRGHGGSAGRTTSFGWLEQLDLEGALVYLGRQSEGASRSYGVCGISMGAAVALSVAARDERLGVVVADSSYANLAEALSDHMARRFHVPRLPFGWFVFLTYRLRFGAWPHAVSPQAAASALAPRALLVVHGSQDSTIHVRSARRIFDAASEPKQLKIVDGVEHPVAFNEDFEVYRKRLAGFLAKYL